MGGGSFAGQAVWITGASSGIGAELARGFAEEGASVVLAARREDRLRDLAAEIEAKGARALAVSCDVTRDGDCEKAVARAVEAFGRLDVAVANAGFGVVGNLEKITLDDYRRQMDTNVFGVLRTIYAALPEVKKSHGSLVLMGSVMGHLSLPGSSAYAMSKFAVTALAAALRHELRRARVAVTLVSPGFVESEIYQVDNKGEHLQAAKDHRPEWLRMPTRKAARQMIRAVRRRKAEAVITLHGKAAVFVHRHAPWLVDAAVTLAGARARPEPKA